MLGPRTNPCSSPWVQPGATGATSWIRPPTPMTASSGWSTPRSSRCVLTLTSAPTFRCALTREPTRPVAFLTGEGEFLAGRPYTPPDEMAALLERISSGEFVPETQAGDGTASPGSIPATGSSADAVLSRLTDLYDDSFGGFGLEPKQPPWEALSFLSARYGLTGNRQTLSMVESTLRGMLHGIYDPKDQGFFRYAVSRDWKVPHYEKMLVSNSNLLLAYLAAYQITRRSLYRSAAEGILAYLRNNTVQSGRGFVFRKPGR